MNGSRTNYVLVGAFVVATVGGLVVLLATMSGWTVGRDPYFTVLHNVTGVRPGTRVTFEGYPVGRVSGISAIGPAESERLLGPAAAPWPTWFRVDLELEKGWRIPAGSEARIIATGLLTAVVVEITQPDRAEANMLAVGSMIQGRDTQTLTRMMEHALGLTDTVASLVSTIEATLERGVDPVIADTRELIATLSEGLQAALARIDAVGAGTEAAVAEFALLVGPDNRQQVEAAIAALADSARHVNGLIARLDTLAVSLDGMVTDNRRDVDAAVRNLRYVTDSLARDVDEIGRNVEATTRNLHELSRRLRRNPGLLVTGTAPDAAEAAR
ncbi:MAG: MCE family protein [Rhodospirillales bacterium]|nr:MAG: MCE family protein [Rhodospirillales bacterium]